MSQSPISYQKYCAEGAVPMQYYIEATPEVTLNMVLFSPAADKNLTPIVFLPGLGSVIDNFRDTLVALTANHAVYYVETREKGSSIITGRPGFSIPEIAGDIPIVIEKAGLHDNGYILVGYSLGTAVIAASAKDLAAKPLATVLIEPSATFIWPWWLLPVAKYGVGLYGAIKPFLKWYMRTFRINREGDYEMYEINSRILDQADPRKLAATVIAIADFTIWSYLETIDNPCLVIGVSHDKFHSHGEASSIAQAIEGCEYYDVETNKRSHSSEVALIINDFLKKKGLNKGLAALLVAQ